MRTVRPYDEDEPDDLDDRTLSMRRVPEPTTFADKRGASERRQQASNWRIGLITVVVIAVLYLAKPVVVPVALAILFAFLLSPIVSILERTFIRRTGAIVLSLGIAVAGLGLGGWWIYQQFNAVAKEFTESAALHRVEQRMRFLRRSSSGLAIFERFERTLQRVTQPAQPPEKPLNVRVVEDTNLRDRYRNLAPTIEGVASIFSAALPTFLALGVFSNWLAPLAVLGLFVLSDQLIGGFVEPIVVGHRVGVSPIALLCSAIFWGWLWGPVGLLLATPISVCLTVGGEFIPALRIFSIMFGAEDPLEGYLSFYNRLLLRDRTGAIAIADRHAETDTMEEMFADLFIPTLTFAQEEIERKRITPAHDHFIKDVIRELIIRFGDRNAIAPTEGRHIVGVSVAGERLSLGTLMLTQLLRAEGYAIDYFTDLPDDELLAFISEVMPEAVFVSCTNPDHLDAGYQLIQLISSSF